MKQGLVTEVASYRYSSASPEFAMNEVPQRLKPSSLIAYRSAESAAPPNSSVVVTLPLLHLQFPDGLTAERVVEAPDRQYQDASQR